jgi:hypothetical protein
MLRSLLVRPPSFALALPALIACASAEPVVFDVRVDAISAGGNEPVAGALVLVRGAPAATTDALGRSLLHVRGQAGDRVPVSLACPPAGTASEAELILLGAPPASAAEAPALRLACPVAPHDAVVLVHASGSAASLPVELDGAVVGHTDRLGFAHVHVRAGGPAGFDISLDTSANPALSPAHPMQHFQLEHSDELFVFDTAFDSAPATKASKARRASGKRRRALAGVD